MHSRYLPDCFDFHSEMIIREDRPNGLVYKLELDNAGYYTINIKKDNSWIPLHSNLPFASKYDNLEPCETPELLNEITLLKEYTDRKARDIHCICNDTRNYGTRFNAENDHGKLTLYGESFNYNSPELCEYYQLEISSDGFVFTVSNASRFMYRYLGKKRWRSLYNDVLPPIQQKITSLEDVYNSKWYPHFQSLLDSAKDLLLQMQQRDIFLFNARELLDIGDLMRFFHVEDAFECIDTYDPPFDIIPQKDQIMGTDGNPITVDDFYRAAELGIFTLEDLCDIRSRYGSLENILHITLLS